METTFKCRLTCTLAHGNGRRSITVHGAREHNLKNICFELPKGKLIALTGPSGSGKSSIAVNVLQMECLRQFLESLGMTTDHIVQPDVDKIVGLAPSIGVAQRVSDVNSRSTVGTKSGLLVIVRNLFASIGTRPCERCGRLIRQRPPDHSCCYCGHKMEPLKMAHFSPLCGEGMCPACKGTQKSYRVDVERLFDDEKSVQDGGVRYWTKGVERHYAGVIESASKHYGFEFDTSKPMGELSLEQRNFLLYGITGHAFRLKYKGVEAPKKVGQGKFEGLVQSLLSHARAESDELPDAVSSYISQTACEVCAGTGLGAIGRGVTVGGKTICEVAALPLSKFLEWIDGLEDLVSPDDRPLLATLECALKERTANLIEVGLSYLTLDRSLPTLSGGEAQRVRLASILGSQLMGVLYVLDEPTAGLHPHDCDKVVRALRKIQRAGNTVIIIEHNLEVIRAVDYILELGPGGGSNGGEIICSGTPDEVMATTGSITGKWLKRPPLVDGARAGSPVKKRLTVRGAAENNLKKIDVAIPVGQLVALTGVSGSGKSTFLFDIVDRAARKQLHNSTADVGRHLGVEGLDHFNRVVTVDHSTIGRVGGSRSNVATYTGLFDRIRSLFASLPQSRIRGYGAHHFSFNVSDQRCEVCDGAGVVAVDMAFMPDVEMKCSACGGGRFSQDLLCVEFKGQSIADLLDLSVCEALEIFSDHPNIYTTLEMMRRLHLDYLTLGQSTNSLSGGEAQRIKLAKELCKLGKRSTLFLLDEPAAGLHRDEVESLLAILRELVSRGHSVLAIEHHLEVISRADTVIDFGPGSGDEGGRVVAIGTPQEVSSNGGSFTGRCLKEYFGRCSKT